MTEIGISTSHSALIAELSRTASSEWPPTSKKWSWTPTWDTPRISVHIRARVISVASRGFSNPAPEETTGSGSRLRSIFLFAVSGSSSSTITMPGTMYGGRDTPAADRTSDGFNSAPFSASR